MKIIGRLGTYHCEWKISGYSFAEVVVSVEKVVPGLKFLGFTLIKETIEYEKVWESRGSGFPRQCTMRLATPEHLHSWYTEVVKEYEDYCLAWANNPYKD